MFLNSNEKNRVGARWAGKTAWSAWVLLAALGIAGVCSWNAFGASSTEAYRRALASFQAQDYSATISICESLIKTDPEDIEAKNLLIDSLINASEIQYRQGNIDRSFEYMQRAMELDPALAKDNQANKIMKSADGRNTVSPPAIQPKPLTQTAAPASQEIPVAQVDELPPFPPIQKAPALQAKTSALKKRALKKTAKSPTPKKNQAPLSTKDAQTNPSDVQAALTSVPPAVALSTQSAVPRANLLSSAEARRFLARTKPKDIQSFQIVMQQLIHLQEESRQATEVLGQDLNRSIQQSAVEQKQAVAEQLRLHEAKRNAAIEQEVFVLRILMAATAAISLLSLFVALWIVIRQNAKYAKRLVQQERRLLEILDNQSDKMEKRLQSALESLPLEGPVAEDHRLNLSEDTALKLRCIEMIEAKMRQDSSMMTDQDANVLHSLLEDPNPMIKTRALEALFRRNPQETYPYIENLLASGKIEEKVAAIRVLSGIATEKSVEFLSKLLLDPEEEFRRRAIIALRSLLGQNLPSELEEKINRSLGSVISKESWIVR